MMIQKMPRLQYSAFVRVVAGRLEVDGRKLFASDKIKQQLAKAIDIAKGQFK